MDAALAKFVGRRRDEGSSERDMSYTLLLQPLFTTPSETGTAGMNHRCEAGKASTACSGNRN